MKKMLLNKSLCVGCHYCEIMCSLTHSKEGMVNVKKARIRVIQDPKNGEDYPNVCRQCAKPKCIEACKFGALSVNPETGATVVDYEKCTGCMECQKACPFDAVQMDAELRQPLICDLCGGDPECLKHCRILPHMGARCLNYEEPSEWKATPRSSIKVVGDLQ